MLRNPTRLLLVGAVVLTAGACGSGGGGSGGTPASGGNAGAADQGSQAEEAGSVGMAGEANALLVDPPSGPAEVVFTVDASAGRHSISPHIYGINVSHMRPAPLPALVAEVGFAMARAGGNRFSAYNWETNASNAGADWLFQNDAFLRPLAIINLPDRDRHDLLSA